MVSLIVFSIAASVCVFLSVMLSDAKEHRNICVGLFGAAVLFLIVGLVSYPFANVWQKQLSGQAQLKEAEWNRQIKVKESEAFLASAKNLALAEIERAKGAAEANHIIADGLGGPQGYLRYLFIEGLKIAHENGNQIIYIPTEAGLPITEANRLLEAHQ